MASQISIYIPLPAHLVQYMKTAAARGDGSLKLTEKSLFGLTILSQLKKPNTDYVPTSPTGDYLEIVLRYRLAKEYGCYLEERSEQLILKWVKRAYEEKFLDHIRMMRIMHGTQTEEAIQNWRNLYGITEDMRAMDSDCREFYRKR
jgi:hypothetical protein